MRSAGDPRADHVLSQLLASGGIPKANKVLSHLIGNHDWVSGDAPPVLSEFLRQTDSLPKWAEVEKIHRAQRLFTSQGPAFGLVLMAQSLPVLYAGGLGGAQVLYATGQLSGHFRRRASQTLRFILDVMEPGGLEPMGKGIRAIQKVRLMHAAIRHYALNGPLWQDRKADWGMPINQEELAGTLLAFSSVALDGLGKLEIEIDPEDYACYLHTWRAIGEMLGIQPEMLPQNKADAQQLWGQIDARNFIPTPEGQKLAAEHLKFLEDLIPDKDFDGIAVSLMYFLMRRRIGRTILHLPRPGWTYFLINILRAILGLEGRVVLSSATLKRVTSRVGQRLMETLYRQWNEGDGTPFKIPDKMG